MPDNNLSAPAEPVDTTPETYDEQVEGLADLLEDPTPEPRKDQGREAADDAEPEDPDGETEAEDVEAGDGAEEPDGSQEPYSGGRFAADNARVKLEDGTTITIAELKRNNLFQRDYTKKTTEHSAAVKAVEARKSEVDQQAQSLGKLSEYIIWYATNYGTHPKPPAAFNGTAQTDPIGYMEYMQQKDQWEQAEQVRTYYTSELAKLDQKKTQETAQARQKRVASEVAKLAAADPLFKDGKKARAWFEKATPQVAEYYGITQKELAGALANHTQMLVLRDALRYRAQKAAAATVQEDVARKPVQATGGKRAEPGTKVAREKQARSERLRREGSMESAVESLMDLDL